MNNLKLCSESWHDHPKVLRRYIEEMKLRSVLEIGAGPNPSISVELVKKYALEYHVNDFSQNELDKGSNQYLKIQGDFIELENLQKYDLICSRMVLEHVKDPKTLHEKIFQHLNPGGIAIHFYATLYSVPAMLNLLLPETISDRLLKWGQNRDPEFHGKFPAMYRWCRGPVKNFSNRFEQLGFEVLEHYGYLGHGYLSSKPNLWPFEKSFNNLLLKINSPLFCSNAIIILQKPTV